MISTTGFGTSDFTRWPEICKWVLILLMFWLHLCCQIIFIGAALNVVLRDLKASRNG